MPKENIVSEGSLHEVNQVNLIDNKCNKQRKARKPYKPRKLSYPRNQMDNGRKN